MTFYLIILEPEDKGGTLEWVTEWFEDTGGALTITTGTTDKRGNAVILLEFEAEEDVPDEAFHQSLKEDEVIADYLIYSRGEES